MASGRTTDLRRDLHEGAVQLSLSSEPSSVTMSPQTVTKRVVSGELSLKFNKKLRGSRA